MHSSCLFISLFAIAIRMVLCESIDISNGFSKHARVHFDSGPPVNPYIAQTRQGTMHGDTASTDTTPHSGPGTGDINYSRINLISACPTIVQANDGFILALCTNIFTREPVSLMLDPTIGTTLASLKLSKGGLFGVVYAYVDESDNLIVADGRKAIHQIAHFKVNGTWQLEIVKSISIQSVLSDVEDVIVGFSPDWNRNIWFASSHGVVGYANMETDEIQSMKLPNDESIANSISTVPEGTFVTTDHALYMINAKPKEIPIIRWRHAYERGPGRKPGQLSWGTGSTATIFGPGNGTEYVTITDNSVPINLLILETFTGKLPCKHPIFTVSGSGTENSPIGSGNKVFVTSTYGYPYLALPPKANNSMPLSGEYTGGFTRVDYDPIKSTCNTVWTNTHFRSATVAKLSISDNLLYTMNRVHPFSDSSTGILDSYYFATIDPDTGTVLSRRFAGFGMLFETQQMAPLITREGHYFQGIVTGINHIWIKRLD